MARGHWRKHTQQASIETALRNGITEISEIMKFTKLSRSTVSRLLPDIKHQLKED